jgi:farnesyl-diphosphate farnesyltransferase
MRSSTMSLPLDDDRAFCVNLLPAVSRTFALTIRLLGPRLRHQVLIAYLLCRVADTVEDTADLPLADKHALLARFRACLDEGGPDAAPLAATFARLRGDGPPRIADEDLTEHADRVLAEYRRLSPAVRAAIRPWVQEMCDGMARFAALQAQAAPGRLVALDTVEDLDRYCYYVAGTVGHLLTELFRIEHPRVTARHYDRMRGLATSFGLGLQLTNIIKDICDDRSRGWSFVPRQLCRVYGTDPERLTDPAHADRSRRVLDALIAKTRGHLDDALAYSCALPRSAWRTRLFCLVPMYFAVRTLSLAARDPRLLDPGHKVKITRGEVYRTLCTSYLVASSNHLARAYYQQLVRKRAR